MLTSREARADVHLDASSVEAQCPTATELHSLVRERLARDPFTGDGAQELSVTIVRGATAPALDARVELTQPGGTTGFRLITSTSGDCAALVRAVALAVAVALDRDEQGEAADQRTAPPAPEATSVREAPTARPETVVDAAPERVIAFGSALAQVGLAPRPSTGASLEVRARVSPSSFVSLRGTYVPPSDMPAREFSMSLADGALGACAEPWTFRNVAPFGCAYALAGAHAVHDAAVPVARQAGFFAAASASVGARFAVRRPFSIAAQAEALLPLTRPIYATSTCPSTGFEAPFVTVALSLGVGVTIW